MPIPSAYLAQFGEGVNKNKTFKDVYGWGASSAVEILKNREYLGHTVNFKTRKHFKDKKSHYVPKDEWTIFEKQAHFTIACRGICCEHTTAANCAAYEELCSLYGKTSDCLITMYGAGLESDH